MSTAPETPPAAPPALHAQRKLVLAAALAGVVGSVLPWRLAFGASSASGLKDAGVFTLIMFLASAACALLKDRSGPIELMHRIGVAAPALLAFIGTAIRWLMIALNPNVDTRIGIYLVGLAAAGIELTIWCTPAPVPEGPPRGMAAQVFDRLRRLFRDVSGKRAAGKAEAIRRQDDLLKEIGQAALGAGVPGPEAEAAAKAVEAMEGARQGSGPARPRVDKAAAAKGLVAQKSGLKAAESKADRALRRLGRLALDRGLELEGMADKAAEVRRLDAVIKDLNC